MQLASRILLLLRGPYRRPNYLRTVDSLPPWSARPSHVCWLTWSSWAQACSDGPSWRPTSKRFRVRAGSLHLSCRRLLSAALAVRRRWQGECCHEAGDGEGRYDGGRGAEHPEREAEGPRGRGPGGADARARAVGLRTPALPRSTEGSRCSLRTRDSPRSLLPVLRVAPPVPRTPRGRTLHAPRPGRRARVAGGRPITGIEQYGEGRLGVPVRQGHQRPQHAPGRARASLCRNQAGVAGQSRPSGCLAEAGRSSGPCSMVGRSKTPLERQLAEG